MRGKLEDGNKEGEMRVEGRRVFFFLRNESNQFKSLAATTPLAREEGGPLRLRDPASFLLLLHPFPPLLLLPP